MKISPELVVGNTWLHMLERDPNRVVFKQREFLEFSNRLQQKISEIPECIENGRYVAVHLGDILDTTCLYLSCVDFVRKLGDESPSEVHLKDTGDSRDKLIRKLNIYIRGTTPKWLLDVIEQVANETLAPAVSESLML